MNRLDSHAVIKIFLSNKVVFLFIFFTTSMLWYTWAIFLSPLFT